MDIPGRVRSSGIETHWFGSRLYCVEALRKDCKLRSLDLRAAPPVSSGMLQCPPKASNALQRWHGRIRKKLDLFLFRTVKPIFCCFGMRNAHFSHPCNGAGGNLSRECIGKTGCGRKSVVWRKKCCRNL